MAASLLLVTVALLIDARRWLRLAGRSRVGARSEDEVQRALAQLETEGWRLRHSLPWRGRGDIDSVAIAPTGVAFAARIGADNATNGRGVRPRPYTPETYRLPVASGTLM